MRAPFIFLCFALMLACSEPTRPNVLFIVVDDLNDWIQLLDLSAPIRTPNLQRLAERGTLFARAYSASSACNPSRVATLTGLRPSSTGVYGNDTDWRRALPDAVTIPQHFREHGYSVAGAGKIFHHQWGGAFHDNASFDEFLMMPNPPDAPMPNPKRNRLGWYGSPNTDWGIWPPVEEDSVDHRTATYAVEFLGREHEKPFFLAIGIFRPHMPFFAPETFFEQYPEDSVTMPLRKDGDLDDIPPGGKDLLKGKLWFWQGMMKAETQRKGTWRDAVRAYQAAASFADHQIGRVLNALDVSDHADNTVIVLWSDHGYHLGEKDHWEKFMLWEKTTHVPLIVVAPGVTQPGTVCNRPVDLTAIYPTLVELCSLTAKPELEGTSLAPLLRDPAGDWAQPAIMTYGPGNHAIRNDRWRYIRYADGTEELYDHWADPNEWTNVAVAPENAAVKEELAQWLPKKNAPSAPSMEKPQ